MSAPDAARRSPLEVPASLADVPLDEIGVTHVERAELALDDDAFEARLFRLRPALANGAPHPGFSACLAREPRVLRSAAASERARVRFEFDGTMLRCQVAFDAAVDVYGMGLVCGALRRNGRQVTLWNTDAWRYDETTRALYQSHPCALCVLPDGRAVAVLADAFRAGQISAHDDGLEFGFEEEPFDLYLIEADSPAAATRALAALVGRIELPARWTLGYHQCRWGYMSADEVRSVARGFRERGIPCDALWLDIDHMDRHRSFTFDPERFAEPEALCTELHDDGFHVVAIVDPGVADAPDCALAQSGRDGDHFVRSARGEFARGRVWPGICLFPDFTRPETRAWWAEQASRFVARGLDGLWLDMNEPSVFRAPRRTLPDDARHAGLGGGTHARFHNLYGRLGAEATRDGVVRALPERRPFVLARSNHLGGARSAAAWTGDNQATWQDLRATIPMVLNLGLSGQPFCGPDLGGFDGDPSAELFARWFQLGAYLPFARGHGAKGACRKEPWSFGVEVEGLVRAALEARMRLLPTLYTLFAEAARSGLPVARPLFFADAGDAALRAVDDAFLLGDALLVAPVLERGARVREVVLPSHAGGGWYERASGALLAPGRTTVAAPLDRCPVFARAGAIVVESAGGRTADEAAAAPLHLHVYLDARGAATGSLYEDAGDGHGAHRLRTFTARRTADGVVLESSDEGEWHRPRAKLHVTLHDAGRPIRTTEVEEAASVSFPR